MIKKTLKKQYWLLKKKNFKSAGDNVCISIRSDITGAKYIILGNSFSAGKNLKLQAWKEYKGINLNSDPSLIIGNNVSFMNNCQISCANKVVISDGTLLGDNVFITDNFHGNNSKEEINTPPLDRPLSIRGEVWIGENVWIGRNVCIMPGVKIGDGSVIGANAVVTHDIPAGCIAAGVPAVVIREME